MCSPVGTASLLYKAPVGRRRLKWVEELGAGGLRNVRRAVCEDACESVYKEAPGVPEVPSTWALSRVMRTD